MLLPAHSKKTIGSYYKTHPFLPLLSWEGSGWIIKVIVFVLQMTWWQTNGWTSRLQWLTSCPPAQPTSSPAPSAHLAWTTPARGRAAPPTTSKDTRKERKKQSQKWEIERRKINKWIRMKQWKGSEEIKWYKGNKRHKAKKSVWREGRLGT